MSMGLVHSNEIVIDNSAIECKDFIEVIEKVLWYWKAQVQTKCKSFLCIVHMKRALKKNLLPKV